MSEQVMPVAVEKRPSFLRRHRRRLLMVLGGLVLIFVVMQLIPLDQTNPPVKAEPNWDSPQTRELAAAACFDCHSNETDWSPWYADLAPARFLVWRHVDEGRAALNFSEWSGRETYEIEEVLEVIDSGEMPPPSYLWMHPEAKLSDEEKQQLMDGFARTLSGGSGTSAVPASGEDRDAAED